MNQTLAIDTMNSTRTSSCENNGTVSGLATGLTGQPQYHWEGPGTNGPIQVNASSAQNLPPGWYYFTVTDNVCSVEDSIYVDQEPAPVADFNTNVISGCSPLSVLITNTSQNANMYSWDFGNGNTLNTADLSTPINQVYNNDAVIRLIASKGPCADTMWVSIDTDICGCMDPEAINYNPTANVDNGSCIYPIPEVEVPNVFSPNGDGVNDTFFLTTKYVTNIKITIVDRWDLPMVEVEGLNPSWDGKINGLEASEGVYFYHYEITGMAGASLEGHGFVQLFR